MTPIVELNEWETREIALSREAAAALRARPGNHFDIAPSWTVPGVYSVTARGVAGSVALPGCYLVIKPKVELSVAIHMLEAVIGEAGNAPPIESGSVAIASSELTAAIAHWFTSLALPLVERRLVRRYRLHEELSYAVRGRVNIPATARRGPFVRPELLCQFDEHTLNVTENATLRAANRILDSLPALPPSVRSRLRRVDHALADVDLRIPPRWERDQIVFDRLNAHYRPVLAIASWILDKAAPEFGRSASPRAFETFLVQMQGVFETYVAVRLAAALAHARFSCVAKPPEHIDSEKLLFRTEPDILVRGPSGALTILDTKYKAFDVDYRPSQADIYQVISYCVTRGADRAFLVYPERAPGQLLRTHTIVRGGLTITLFPIAVGLGRAVLQESIEALAEAVRAKRAEPHQ